MSIILCSRSGNNNRREWIILKGKTCLRVQKSWKERKFLVASYEKETDCIFNEISALFSHPFDNLLLHLFAPSNFVYKKKTELKQKFWQNDERETRNEITDTSQKSFRDLARGRLKSKKTLSVGFVNKLQNLDKLLWGPESRVIELIDKVV